MSKSARTMVAAWVLESLKSKSALSAERFASQYGGKRVKAYIVCAR